MFSLYAPRPVMRRHQFALRALLLSILTLAIMCLTVFPLWVAYAVQSVEAEQDRWWRERFAPPPGWKLPPGWHIGENGWVVADDDKESK